MFRPTEPRAPIAAEPIDDEIIDFIGSRQFLDVRIPRTPYKGKLRLVARAELFAIKAAARKFFLEHDMPLDNHAAFGGEEWSNELAVRMLAVAVRNPRDPQLELAPLAEWRELDDDQVDGLWRDYLDFAARIDPIGHKPDLTREDVAAIERAAKKAELDLLMSFGSRKLALFAMRSVDPPSS